MTSASRNAVFPFIPIVLGALLSLPFGDASAIAFEDVTESSGRFSITESWGASAGDFNNDGWTDLWHNSHRMRPYLYLNEGNGFFSDITLAADKSAIWIGEPEADTHSGSWGDFNNDGFPDLIVGTAFLWSSQLLVNYGGALYDEASRYGVAQDDESQGQFWIDFSGDSLLDATAGGPTIPRLWQQTLGNSFVQRRTQAGFTCTRANQILLADLTNDGHQELICVQEGVGLDRIYDVRPYATSNGAVPFTDLTSIVPATPNVNDLVAGDFDGNLQTDLFAVRGKLRRVGADLVSPTRIEAMLTTLAGQSYVGFTFQGGERLSVDVRSVQVGRFRVFIGSSGLNPTGTVFSLDRANPMDAGLVPPRPGMPYGLYIGYIGNDTWEARLYGSPGSHIRGYFMVDHAGGPLLSNVVMSGQTPWDVARRSTLYLNQNGIFSDQTVAKGLGPPVSCASAGLGDFDNDMDLDLYLVCQTAASNIANRLYSNRGDGSFVEVPDAGGAAGPVGGSVGDGAGTGDSVVVADFDGDGFLDLFVTNGLNLEPQKRGGPNKLYRNRGNDNQWLMLDLVGTMTSRDALGAKVFVTAGGITQLREQNGGYHRWSQNDKRLHFGLGGHFAAERVEVRWPSGAVDVFSDVPAGAVYRLTEGVAGSGAGSIEPVGLGPVSPLPEPRPGDECGEPPYNHVFGPALLVWRDCPGDTWHVRAKGGRTTDRLLTYEGSVTGQGRFGSPSGHLLDSNDRLDGDDPTRLLFSLSVWFSNDNGFDFDASGVSSPCFNLESPAGTRVLVGNGRWAMQRAFDLRTFGPCERAGEAKSIDIAGVTLSENAGSAEIRVSVSPAPGQGEEVRVGFSTEDLTALAGADYRATSGSLVFAPGIGEQSISVPILDDAIVEGDESFRLRLTDAIGGTLVSGEATVTIRDDDRDDAGAAPTCGAPVVDSATEAGVFLWQDCADPQQWRVLLTAGGIPTTYRGSVTAAAPFQSLVGVSQEASDNLTPGPFSSTTTGPIAYLQNVGGTGSDGFDFRVAASGEVCFALTAPTGRPLYIGSDRISATTPVSLRTFGPCEPTPTLPVLSIGDVTVSEGAGSVSFPVSLSEAAGQTVTVSYASADGTAASGADYTPVAGILTFGPGETRKSISVSIIEDTAAESTETFRILLSNAAGAIPGTATGTGNIADNDGAAGPACGPPTFNSATDTGLFLWQDCTDRQQWSARFSAGGQLVSFSGRVTSDVPFLGMAGVSQEASDQLMPGPFSSPTQGPIAYVQNVGGTGFDGFDFRVDPDSDACFAPAAPPNRTVWLGADRVAVTSPINLRTFGVCTP